LTIQPNCTATRSSITPPPLPVPTKFTTKELAALLVAVSFATRQNVYATIATLGLLAAVQGPIDRSSSPGWLGDGRGDHKGQPPALAPIHLTFLILY
jgi:hypothetical protein